jgi:hypothetical protein
MTTLDPARQQPVVLVHFSAPDRRYGPGERLEARYTVEGTEDLAVQAVERSVLWYTEGKGEEDLGVHWFERLPDPPLAGSFACQLPPSPLSYEGLIVKIRWCVRIRLFFSGGRDFVSEHAFDVGRIPAAAYPPRP